MSTHNPAAKPATADHFFAHSQSQIIRDEAQSFAQDWKLLRRLSLPDQLADIPDPVIRHGLVLDCESTGLEDDDEVVQLAMLPFTYDARSMQILSVDNKGAFEAMREPSKPMGEMASFVTGITDEMLAGTAIDEDQVNAIAERANFIIAHNARFDRPMVEKHWPVFKSKPWGCSLDAINWTEEGYTAGKLDYLGMQFGWFYDGHRALADCEALLALLAQRLPKSERGVLQAVLDKARGESFVIEAVGAPFETKDALKARGYRWNGAARVWWIEAQDGEAELEWLGQNVYRHQPDLPVRKVTAMQRYSKSA